MEKRVPSELRTRQNSKGETPKDIFYANHKELSEAVKEEVKVTVKCGIFVAPLFGTVLAAFLNGPGGDNTSMLVDLALAVGNALLFALLSVFWLWSILVPPLSVEVRFSTLLQRRLREVFVFRMGCLHSTLMAIVTIVGLIIGTGSPHAPKHHTASEHWVVVLVGAYWLTLWIYIRFVHPIFQRAKGY